MNYLFYFIGWCALIIGGANNYNYLPSLFVIGLVWIQLFRDDLSAYYIDLFIILILLVLGFLLEFILINFHIVEYAHSQSMFPPLWLLMVYPLFAMTINHSFYWVMQNPYLAFWLGLIGAPLTYLAAEKLGAVNVHHLYVLGVLWALLLFFSSYLLQVVTSTVQEILTIASDPKRVTLLYDGECPICSKEVNYLEKRTSKVDFVDISKADYESKKYQNVTYQQAMQKMHAIEEEEHVIVGLEAFRWLYAKSNLHFLAILISLPGLRGFFQFLYSIFAQYRLKLTGRSSYEKKYRNK